MMVASHRIAPFLALRKLISGDYRERVVARALDYRRSATTTIQRRADKAFDTYLKVDGFRHASRAPAMRLQKETAHAFPHQVDIATAVLDLWVESQSELEAVCRRFLGEIETELEDIFEMDNHRVEGWSAEMKEVLSSFAAKHGRQSEDDAALMLCCLVGESWTQIKEQYRDAEHDAELQDIEDIAREAAVLTEGRSDAESVLLHGTMWRQWLDVLAALPADAPEWTTASEFTSAVRQLAESKRRQTEQESRVKLHSALARLLNESMEALAYFGFEDCSAWSAESCSPNEAEMLADRVSEMQAALEHYTQLRAQVAPTLAEDKSRLNKLSELQEVISRVHEQLAVALATSVSEGTSEENIDSDKTLERLDDVAATNHQSITAISSLPEENALPNVLAEPTHAEANAEKSALLDNSEDAFANSTECFDINGAQKISLLPTSPSASTGAENHPEGNHAASETVAASPLHDDRAEDFSERQSSKLPSTAAFDYSENSNQSIEESNWNELLWKFIEEEDVPAAYWLSRSLAAANLSCAVPSWLLAALQGSEWSSPESYTLTQDLAETVRNHVLNEGTSHLEALGIAAGLRPSLIAPDTGLQEWLKRTNHSASLNKLTGAVKEFANLGKPLQPEIQLAKSNLEDAPIDARTNVVKEAEKWIAEASLRRAKNKGATDVWRKMVTAGGDVWELLLPVSQNRQQSESLVLQSLERLEDAPFVSQRIDEVHLETVSGRKVQPIQGAPRQQIMRDVQEACKIARRWCAAIKRERETSVRGDWLTEQTARLRATVIDALPAAEVELQELHDSAEHKKDSAIVQCLIRSLRQLRQQFHLPLHGEAELQNKIRIATLKDESLVATLARRLLWLPEVPLDDEGQPTIGEALQTAIALEHASDERRTLKAAFELWIQKQDYRFASRIMEMLPPTDAAEAMPRLQSATENSRVLLRRKIEQTLEAIEQGVVDGIIADAQRAAFSAEIEAIVPEEVFNFTVIYNRLEAVASQLAAARERRLQDLVSKWKQMEPSVAPRVSADKLGGIRSFVQTSFTRGDTRVVDECLARLGEMLEGGGELEDALFAPAVNRDVLGEFLRAAPEIEAWLGGSEGEPLAALPKILEEKHSIGAWKVGELLPTRRAEAADAVRAWTELKRRGAQSKESVMYVKVILRYLGFTFVGSESAAVRVERRGSDWLHARAAASASDLAKPIPQFGSLAGNNCDVICLWGRPSTDTIGARLHEARLDGRSLLVFYFGHLTMQERTSMARLAREREFAFAIMDDVLLTFLAGEKDARMRAFLRCALPFSAVNPYTPFQAGDTPPEMFFGREAMARELRRTSGSCIVYGGRQLGKSALLRHAQREFHQPEQGQYALVEDIKIIGDSQSGQPTDDIWRKIREGFVRLGLMKRTTDKPEEIRRSVRQTMMQARRFVLIMFDEADNFLDADAADGFRVVTELRALMTATERRFKVVFAGLQNVQRFQGIPNQPLAHFGRPILVGPLEPKAAHELVREPFETLGYRFADDATVLRILSYTNYHVGLIQLFCRELLERMRSRLGNNAPPYSIEREDVESVYRIRQVRDSIRERFDWTLALNARYQAIAWAMIADQMSDHDSYARAYPLSRINELADYWWKQGFQNIGADGLRGTLDEMCGLGVLVRDGNGRYRLRSPNLVRLMGTEADIESRLVELSQKPPEVKYDAESHHAQLDETARCYSPLTYAQERLLNPPQFGVGLMFASNALGFEVLEDTTRRFIPADLPNEVQAEFAVIPSEINSAGEIEKWLREFLEARSKHERLIIFQKADGSAESMTERVREALRFCRTRRSQKQWMRILFAFDCQSSWQWMSLPQNLRAEMEERCDAALSAHKWNLFGIRQRLARANKLYSDEVCQEVLRATGGWLWLLDNLFNRCQQDDPRGCAQSIEHELAEVGSDFSQQWRKTLSLDDKPDALRVLRFILSEEGSDGVPRDLVAPEFLGEGRTVSQAECDAAVEYLQRMGCVDLQNDLLRVDSIVRLTLAGWEHD